MNKNPNSFELGPHTLRQTNIAIEPVPFEGVFPIGNGDMHGYSIAVLVYRTVKSDIWFPSFPLQQKLAGRFKCYYIFSPYMGRWSDLTSIFFKWVPFNHHPPNYYEVDLSLVIPI